MCKHKNDQFCQLHLHSTFSQRDGAIDIRKLVDKAHGEFGQTAVATTDHGTMAGCFVLYQYCNNIHKKGVKPIAGCEFYYNPLREELMEWLPKAKEVEDKAERKALRDTLSRRYHFTAIAQNRTGYYNMIKMHNDAWVNGYYHRPQVSRDALEKYSDGVVVFSGCQSGIIPSKLALGQIDEARKLVDWYKNIFKDRFYIELMPINSKVQRPLNEALIELAKANKVPVVVTNDSHYLNKDDAEVHQILLNLDKLKMEDDDPDKQVRLWEFDVDDLYLKSAEGMFDSWKNQHKTPVFTEKIFDEGMDNVWGIIQSVEPYDLEAAPMLPKLAEDEWNMLCELTMKGLKEKVSEGLIDGENLKVYHERIKEELQTYLDVKGVSYALVNWDIARFCKENGIPMGAGRGSAAGSLVLYLLGVTDVDPIRYNLLFSRFLNPSRTTKMKFEK